VPHVDAPPNDALKLASGLSECACSLRSLALLLSFARSLTQARYADKQAFFHLLGMRFSMSRAALFAALVATPASAQSAGEHTPRLTTWRTEPGAPASHRVQATRWFLSGVVLGAPIGASTVLARMYPDEPRFYIGFATVPLALTAYAVGTHSPRAAAQSADSVGTMRSQAPPHSDQIQVLRATRGRRLLQGVLTGAGVGAGVIITALITGWGSSGDF